MSDTNLSDFQIDFIKSETDHYFQAELGHDQRASWLLALSSTGVFIVFTVLTTVENTPDTHASITIMKFCLALFAISTLLITFSLWPLATRNAKLWNPWKKNSPSIHSLINKTQTDLLWQHYTGHRKRAEIKASRIIWGLFVLLCGLILLCIATLVFP